MPPDPAADAESAPEVLDERALRRPDFQDGQVAKLADGRDWVLARPVVRWVPDDGELGARVRVRFRGDPALAAGYEAAYARLQALNSSIAAGEKVSAAQMLGAELACCSILLRVNYDLTPGRVADLLQFSLADGDAEGRAIRDECMNVVYGIDAPKPSGGGDTSPSSPTA